MPVTSRNGTTQDSMGKGKYELEILYVRVCRYFCIFTVGWGTCPEQWKRSQILNVGNHGLEVLSYVL